MDNSTEFNISDGLIVIVNKDDAEHPYKVTTFSEGDAITDMLAFLVHKYYIENCLDSEDRNNFRRKIGDAMDAGLIESKEETRELAIIIDKFYKEIGGNEDE